MFDTILYISLAFFSISNFLGLYRVIKGPTGPDRAIALDMIGINVIASAGILAILLDSYALTEIILLIGIVSFISTISIARYIERGVVIERNSRDN